MSEPTDTGIARLSAKPTGPSVGLGFSCLGPGNALHSARKPTTTADTAVSLITVTRTEGRVPNPDGDGRGCEGYLHPRFRIDSNEANGSHIGWRQSLLAKRITNRSSSHRKRMVEPSTDFLMACRGEIVCFELGAPKGTRTPVFAVRGRRPRPLDDGSDGRNT